jgi:uncharacterized protein
MDFKTFMSQWYVHALMVLVLAGLVASFGAYTYQTLKSAKYNFMGPTTINVRGEGEVFAKPDIGSFSFSVRAEGKDAAEAQNKSAEAMNAVLAYLKEAGVEDKDVKTTNYTLYPTYDYGEDRVCAWGQYCPPVDPVIDGYEVSQMVEVKVRDLDKSGDLISGVGGKGATDISGLSFTIDDETELKAQAREQAIEEAKEKAKQLADDLDVRIVRMVGFYEEENYPMPYYGGYGGDMAMSKESAMVSPGMPTGENTITATVNITYEIK